MKAPSKDKLYNRAAAQAMESDSLQAGAPAEALIRRAAKSKQLRHC